MTACKFFSRGIIDEAEGTLRECEEKRRFSQVVAGRWSSYHLSPHQVFVKARGDLACARANGPKGVWSVASLSHAS